MLDAFSRGDLATWGYDESYAAGATDPGTLLEGAQRVICVAIPYRRPAPRSSRPLTGRVSNYAWSSDYHARLRALLQPLAELLDAFAGSKVTRIACDTTPLAERALAARSGVGWVGKHTNLISPAAGSYIFLGEIVTTLALPVDLPLRKSCGSCARCVEACPTAALRGDYTIDATRCIADLVQRTDPVPRELRPLLGDWVWGCDICQVVCPPNAVAKVAGNVEFEPVEESSARPDLIALLHLKSSEFKRHYRRTAMGWRGAAVLRRNAALALGNALDRAAVPALRRSLREDPHPMVRGACAWALGRIGSPAAITALRQTAESETDASVRDEVTAALGTAFGTGSHAAPLENL